MPAPLELSPRFRITELRRMALLTVPHLAILAVLLAVLPTVGRLVPAPARFEALSLARWLYRLPREATTFALGVGLLLMMIGVSLREIGATVQRLRHAEALARQGRVEVLRITSRISSMGWLGKRMRYRYEASAGRQRWASLPLSEGGPCLVRGSRDQIVCLCTADRQTVLLLSLTGYPLARIPADAVSRRMED